LGAPTLAGVPRRSARPLVLLCCVVAVVSGGCRVDATVEARVSGTGGVVRLQVALDREAVAVLGGSVTQGAQTSDLRQAGWEISPVRTTTGGGAEIDVSKAFHRPSDLAAVIGELAGPGGPLQHFSLVRHRSFLETRYRLRGTASLGTGATAATGFANTPDLAARLRDAGVDPDRVESLLAGRAADGLHLRLVAALPGGNRSWTVEPGPSRAIDVSSRAFDWSRLALLLLAAVSAVTALRRLSPKRRSLR
jgi:hypothetical protein